MTSKKQWSDVRCVQYEFYIEIEAQQERVWRGLTDQIGAWWLPDFHMLGPDSLVTLESSAGGRLFEQNGNQQLLWYTVLAIKTNESLDMVGYISSKFGGPATSILSANLSPAGSHKTTLRISDSIYGRVSEKLVDSLDSGWQQLFHDGLKRFLEPPIPSH